jgi:hypothetical protein
MSNPELLAIYLKDHHSTAGGAVELCRRVSKSNSENEFGRKAEVLAAELSRDRTVLEEVMAAVDVDASRVKDAGAWIAEKLGRLKLNGRVVSYSPLSRVVEFEALAMGVAGKIRLWRSLQIARQSDERLAGFDFDALIERAQDQRDTVETLHQKAVEVAFVEGGGA